MCTVGLNACQNTVTARRHWSEQWRHDQVGRRPLYQVTEPNLRTYSEGDLINDDSSLCSQILLTIYLQCHVFPFGKLLLMSVFVCKWYFWWRQIWRHLYEVLLQCWAKFSNFLVRWTIRMFRVKNYETMSKSVAILRIWNLGANSFPPVLSLHSFPFPYLRPIPFPSLPFQLRRGLGQSPSRSRIWCILALMWHLVASVFMIFLSKVRAV